jgi:hypothetical protein
VLILLHDHIDGEGGIACPQLRVRTARLSLVRGGKVLQPLSSKRARIRMVGTFQAGPSVASGLDGSHHVSDWYAAVGSSSTAHLTRRITERAASGLGAAGGAPGSEEDLFQWLAERCRTQER